MDNAVLPFRIQLLRFPGGGGLRHLAKDLREVVQQADAEPLDLSCSKHLVWACRVCAGSCILSARLHEFANSMLSVAAGSCHRLQIQVGQLTGKACALDRTCWTFSSVPHLTWV